MICHKKETVCTKCLDDLSHFFQYLDDLLQYWEFFLDKATWELTPNLVYVYNYCTGLQVEVRVAILDESTAGHVTCQAAI